MHEQEWLKFTNGSEVYAVKINNMHMLVLRTVFCVVLLSPQQRKAREGDMHSRLSAVQERSKTASK